MTLQICGLSNFQVGPLSLRIERKSFGNKSPFSWRAFQCSAISTSEIIVSLQKHQQGIFSVCLLLYFIQSIVIRMISKCTYLGPCNGNVIRRYQASYKHIKVHQTAVEHKVRSEEACNIKVQNLTVAS